MPHPVRALRNAFGPRTFVMLAAAYLWVLVGIGAVQEVPRVQPGVFHLVISGELRGFIWFVTAALAFGFAWSRRFSPIGVGALMFCPSIHAVSYAIAWVLYLLPGPPEGYAAGWYPAAIYSGLCLLAITVALVPARIRPEDVTGGIR